MALFIGGKSLVIPTIVINFPLKKLLSFSFYSSRYQGQRSILTSIDDLCTILLFVSRGVAPSFLFDSAVRHLTTRDVTLCVLHRRQLNSIASWFLVWLWSVICAVVYLDIPKWVPHSVTLPTGSGLDTCLSPASPPLTPTMLTWT